MLTLTQILRRTSQLRKANARYVKINKAKTGINKDGQLFVAAQTHSTHVMDHTGRVWKYRGRPTRYLSVIMFLNRRGHVQVSCSCDDFKYRSEFVLTDHQASDIEYSNGLPPVITNPNLQIYMCKHLVKLSGPAIAQFQKSN